MSGAPHARDDHTVISAAELDRELAGLRDQARRLRPVCRRNPDAWLEDKQELVKAIDDLRAKAKGPVAHILPDLSAIRPGTRVIGRREVVVERRRA